MCVVGFSWKLVSCFLSVCYEEAFSSSKKCGKGWQCGWDWQVTEKISLTFPYYFALDTERLGANVSLQGKMCQGAF